MVASQLWLHPGTGHSIGNKWERRPNMAIFGLLFTLISIILTTLFELGVEPPL